MTTPDHQRMLAEAYAHYRAGRLSDAFSRCERVLAERANDAGALHLSGLVLYAAGRVAEAIARMERGTRAPGADADLWSNLALAYEAAGRSDEAIRARAEAVGRAPNDPAILANLAAALIDAGQSAPAEAAARRAIAVDPNHQLAWFNLALALEAQRRYDEGFAAAERAAALAPGEIAPAGLKAQLALDAGKLDVARSTLEAAIARHPRSAPLLLQLANVAERQRDLAAAARAHAAVIALDPNNGAALSQLIFLKKSLADWSGLGALVARFRGGVSAGAPWHTPFSFLSDTSTRAEQRRCAETWSAGFAAPSPLPPRRPPRSAGRLRIGYLSGDFYQHPTAVLLAGVLERHNRDRFHVVGYSTGPDDHSGLRQRVMHACEAFVDAREWPARQLAERIRADGIDVLVDLKGHTEGAPLSVLALRAAPVQAHWLGYPGTLGASCVDYLIGDAVVTPPAHAADYTEALVRLPGCYQSNDRTREAGETPSREALGLPGDATVLCGFNPVWKTNPAVLQAWARILHDCPGTILWLLARRADDPTVDNLRRNAAAFGLDPSRIVFATHRPTPDYLALYRHADLLLDTWPYNAHTTASDALWMGCPIVTWTGETFAGRVATSLVAAIGVPELAASDVDGYIALASALARDPQRRAEQRKRVEHGVESSTLYDAPAFARALERAYLAMADQARRGVREAIDISP